jgi:CheY-like chemotaxis protein
VKPCLLFVDDEPLVLEGFKRFLAPYREEWDFAWAASVDEALARIEAERIDAVVCDIKRCRRRRDWISLPSWGDRPA